MAILAAIAALPLERGVTAGLALIGVGGLVTRGALSLGEVRSALGPFGAALDLTVELALVLAAAWLTGGVHSPLLLVAAAGLVASRRLHGPAAARFLAFATVLGLIVLAAGSSAMIDHPALAAARVLWPLGVLVAMELALPIERTRAPLPSLGAPPRLLADPIDRPAAPAHAPVAPSPVTPVTRSAPPPLERDFKSEIFHDLRSPLSVIKVYADLIAERARRGEPPVDEHLRNLASEIELMEQMVAGPAAARDRQESAPGTSVDLVRVLGELSARYRETHGEKVRIDLSAERPRVAVCADPVALQRVFRNVLDNALQYTPAGGTVRIRLWADAVHAHVVVSDTGVGMSAE
ncbi:MAG TPA: HAMP domain-containing sensor histidine kinase, partial [Vicinamibacteria bacterium]|nr:HAMP domain-containing sensor histidine kinase [Vicinamibacteria bacterium]